MTDQDASKTPETTEMPDPASFPHAGNEPVSSSEGNAQAQQYEKARIGKARKQAAKKASTPPLEGTPG